MELYNGRRSAILPFEILVEEEEYKTDRDSKKEISACICIYFKYNRFSVLKKINGRCKLNKTSQSLPVLNVYLIWTRD